MDDGICERTLKKRMNIKEEECLPIECFLPT